MGLTLHVDGGSRGNPGPAGAGVVIHDDARGLIHEGGYFLGRRTNNAAEYLALIKGLQRALEQSPDSITIVSDSELLVRQLTGAYRVKSPTLAPLHAEAEGLLVQVGRWTARHVLREYNTRADELANLAMDRREDVIVFDALEGGSPATSAKPTSSLPEARAAASDEKVSTGETPAQSPPGKAVDHPPASPIGAVRVTVSTPPSGTDCPASAWAATSFSIGAVVPPGMCVHAAHAIIPTVLAIQNTDPAETEGVPTLTLRCTRNGCPAVFRVSPERSGNGAIRPH